MDAYTIIGETQAIWPQKYRPVSVAGLAVSDLLAKMLLVLLLGLAIAFTTEAGETKLLFVKSGPASVYDSVINAAKQRINQSCQSKDSDCTKPSISITSVDHDAHLLDLIRHTNWDLIITVGTNAARKINDYHTSSPTLYTLIPSHTYPSIRDGSASRNKSAIYIDQPISRQLLLIKAAMPDISRVGVLLGSHSGTSEQHLKQTMRGMGLEPVIIKVTGTNLAPILKDIFSKIDVLLAQPDPSVYNKKTVMTILLSSYSHSVPVFGYSAAFVRSGAAMSIYSSPTDIGKYIGEEVDKYLSSNNKQLSAPSFPGYFSIDANRSVIRSLNIWIPTTNEIKSRIIEAR